MKAGGPEFSLLIDSSHDSDVIASEGSEVNVPGEREGSIDHGEKFSSGCEPFSSEMATAPAGLLKEGVVDACMGLPPGNSRQKNALWESGGAKGLENLDDMLNPLFVV